MKQLHNFINFKYLDTSNLTPNQDILNYREVINNPTSYDSGDIILSDSTTIIQLYDINFIYLYSNDPFSLTISSFGSSLELETKSFSYNNPVSTIDIILAKPSLTLSDSVITISKLIAKYDPTDQQIYY
jgi:hypothetical protein